jgi:hypothetical protein
MRFESTGVHWPFSLVNLCGSFQLTVADGRGGAVVFLSKNSEFNLYFNFIIEAFANPFSLH